MSARKSYPACLGLAGKIEAALCRRPSTMNDLCRELGFSYKTIKIRLEDLLAADKVHFIPEVPRGGKGIAHVWYIGAAPQEHLKKAASKKATRFAIPDRGPINVPAQVTTRTYAPMNRRDPLVAALFGDGPGRNAQGAK